MMMREGNREMKMVGWFVVGDGKFGSYTYGMAFVSLEDSLSEHNYWTNRGYDLIEAYVKEDN